MIIFLCTKTSVCNEKKYRIKESTHCNVTDLLASQVSQLLDQGLEKFSLLFRKLWNQLLQQRLNLWQTKARSNPNTCRAPSEKTKQAVSLVHVLMKHEFQKQWMEVFPPCGVWVTSDSSFTLVGEMISGCSTPLNFISGPSTQSKESTDFTFSNDFFSPLNVKWKSRNWFYWSPMLVFPMTSGALGLLVFIWTSSSSEAGETQVILSPWKVSVCGLATSAINCGKKCRFNTAADFQ